MHSTYHRDFSLFCSLHRWHTHKLSNLQVKVLRNDYYLLWSKDQTTSIMWPDGKVGVGKYVLCNLHVIQTFVFKSIKHDSDQAENLHNVLPCSGKILHKFYGSHGNNLYVWFGNLQKSQAAFSVSAITVICTSGDNWGSWICNFQILNILINAFSWPILRV